jgi:hypothetical protein
MLYRAQEHGILRITMHFTKSCAIKAVLNHVFTTAYFIFGEVSARMNADAMRILEYDKLKEILKQYAQAFTRYIQCEEAISTYGLLGKHPTTGGAITSPFVQMSQSFQKQANLLWYEIFDIVKQNCTTAFVGNPQNDIMEALLSNRKGR